MTFDPTEPELSRNLHRYGVKVKLFLNKNKPGSKWMRRRNIRIREQIEKLAVQAGETMDFMVYWTLRLEAYTARATELNSRDGRNLSIFDKRTRGAKYLIAMENYERKLWSKRS